MIWTVLFWLWVSSISTTDHSNVYHIKKVPTDFEISGKGEQSIWNQAALLTDFRLPWDKTVAQPTAFRALYTDDFFYFFYDVIDLDIVAPGEARNHLNVLPSDRIEIFFKANGQMSPYYCLEMDPKGRVLDYIARYYRDTDFDWVWPDNELEVKASIKKDGYMVEGKISLRSLYDLEILSDDHSMEAGLFRGDFYHLNSNRTAVRWISWVSPDSEKPDFHIPSAFGKLVFEQNP